MAENKKSFLLYADLIHTVEKLPNEKAGELFKHILEYVNDKNPNNDDLLIQLAFEPIKQQLKRDLEKWGKIREKRSLAGKKSAESRSNKSQQVLTCVESVQQSSTNPTVNDNVNVNVNDNVNVNVKKEKNKDNITPFDHFWEHFHSITGKSKTDKTQAEKYFTKLSVSEQRKAYSSIKPYFESLNDAKYCKKARTYLDDKNFNDEFKKHIPEETNGKKQKMRNGQPLFKVVFKGAGGITAGTMTQIENRKANGEEVVGQLAKFYEGESLM